MVLEKLIKKFSLNPLLLFFFSSLSTIISIYISYVIFESYNGLFIVFFISLVLIPLIEKFKRIKVSEVDNFLRRNSEIFISYFIT